MAKELFLRNYFFLILLLLLLIPSQLLMFKGYRSLDGQIHARRIEQFHKAIQLGQFPPRLAPDLYSGLTYPLFIVNYQLPYYMAESIMFLKNDSMLAYKIVMSTAYILGAIFIFLLFRNIGSDWAALSGAIVFSYLPYRFANLYQRGALGESIALTFVPLILLSTHQITKGYKNSIFLLSLATFGFITSHTLTIPMFAPLIILYIFLILRPSFNKFLLILAGGFGGFLLSSFQLIPAFFEKKYMAFDQNFLNLYQEFFIDFHQLFRIPNIGVDLGTYYQIGVVSTIVVATCVFLLLIKRDRFLVLFLFFWVISIIFTTELSLWLWDNVTIIKYATYPYRFLSLTILSTAFLTVYATDKINLKKTFAVFIILMTFYTNRHFFLTNAPWFEIPPPPSLTTQNESDPIWANKQTFIDQKEIISNPDVEVNYLKKSPFDLLLNVTTSHQETITVRRLYFPGWSLKINGKPQKIAVKDGLITANLEGGTSRVEVFFSKTVTRQVADLVSLFSFLIFLALFVRKNFLK